MKVLILSGSGFLGQAIVSEFEKIIPEMSIVNTTSRSCGVQKGIRYVDFESQRAFNQILEETNPNFIIHLASSCLGKQSEREFRKGVRRDKNLINALKDWGGVVKIVFVASMSCFKATEQDINVECQSPESFYGKEKAEMVKSLKQLSGSSKLIDTKIVYPTSIYGAGQRNKMFLPCLLENIKNNTKMRAKGSKKRRDYVHVSDVSRAIVAIINDFERFRDTDIFLNSGQLVGLGELAVMVCDLLGRNIDDVIVFEDSADDENDYQLIGDSYNFELIHSVSVPLSDGLREMFSEVGRKEY